MIPRMLSQAKGRLKLCRRAFEELRKPETLFEPEEFQTHWVDFLVQWKGTYMKVQQAAKSTPQEVQWFGGINRIRRSEPVLRWLYEARNDEEHYGLSESAVHKPATSLYKIIREGVRTLTTVPDDDTKLVDQTGEVAAVLEHHEPQTDLLREVTERDGRKKVPPPDRYFGRPIPPQPGAVATLGLLWLNGLVTKAEEMSKQAP